MKHRPHHPVAFALVALALVACGDDRRPGADGGGGGDAASGPDSSVDADGGGDTDGGPGPFDGCVLRTSCEPGECGDVPDDCGGTLACAPCPEPACVRDLAVGYTHSCAVDFSGRIQCWGSGEDGAQAGRTGPLHVPGALPGVADAVEVEAGMQLTCARHRDGSVSCWGLNAYGTLGDGTTTSRPTPETVALPEPAVDLSVSEHTVCAALADGSVWCWGIDPEAPLGAITTPRRVEGIDRALRVDAGTGYGCALDPDATMRCFYRNDLNTLGLGLRGDFSEVALSVAVEDVVDMGVSGARACALTGSGEVWCWGGTFVAPRRELDGSAVALSASTNDGVCAEMSDGTVRCIGSADGGVFGTGADGRFAGFTAVPALSGVTQLRLGHQHGCGLDSAQRVVCWGRNTDGQLGFARDSTIHVPAPVDVTCDGPCQPLDCVSLAASCGAALDGCGASIVCGSCGAGETCGRIADGRCSAACGGPGCAEAGATCGAVDDGCGPTSCGSCAAGAACGFGGSATACGCTRTWTIETPALGGAVPSQVALALDDAGAPHVVWADPTALEVRYSRRTSSGWTTAETVGPTHDGSIASASIVVDAAGAVHVAFDGDGLSFEVLSYARRAPSGGWTVVRADSAGDAGNASDIALGPDGEVQIVHVAESGHLHHCIERSAGFECNEVIVSASDARAGSPQIEVDATGRAHIAFRDSDPNASVFATVTPAGHVLSRVLDLGAGYHTDLALAPDGTVHTVSSTSLSPTTATLIYVRRDPDGGQESAGVRTSPAGIMEPSVAVGPDGGVHLLYREGSSVHYGQRTGGTTFSVVPLPALPASQPDLAVDAMNTVHAVFVGPSAGQPFVYATATCM